MRSLKVLLAGAAALLASPAFADNTDMATIDVGGTIVSPLTISSTGNMIMPHLVKPKTQFANGSSSVSGGTTTVTLACQGETDATNTVTWKSGGNPFAAGFASTNTRPGIGSDNAATVADVAKTGACADLTVNGQPNYFFALTAAATTQPSNSVAITGTRCYYYKKSTNVTDAILTGAAVPLGAAGTAKLRCGATVEASVNTIAGDYAGGKIDVTVTYD